MIGRYTVVVNNSSPIATPEANLSDVIDLSSGTNILSLSTSTTTRTLFALDVGALRNLLSYLQMLQYRH